MKTSSLCYCAAMTKKSLPLNSRTPKNQREMFHGLTSAQTITPINPQGNPPIRYLHSCAARSRRAPTSGHLASTNDRFSPLPHRSQNAFSPMLNTSFPIVLPLQRRPRCPLFSILFWQCFFGRRSMAMMNHPWPDAVALSPGRRGNRSDAPGSIDCTRGRGVLLHLDRVRNRRLCAGRRARGDRDGACIMTRA